jgi:hypothetical protein
VACPECAVGYHWECFQQPCCCGNPVTEVIQGSKERGGQIKDPDEIGDIESTGRKRAAQLYPFYEGMKCEWRELYWAGGGVVPIIGCREGLAEARHHGPDKNTINNSPVNVHRICHDCHNRWHALNDSFYTNVRPGTNVAYVPTVDFKQHDSATKATEVEVVFSELWFKTKTKTESYETLRERLEQERLVSGETG